MNKIIWKTHSEEEFRRIVAESDSIADVCRALGYKITGGYYSVVHRRIRILQLDTSHFKGQGWSKNKTFGYRKPITFYLKKNTHIGISGLRRRLLKEGVFEPRCQKCQMTTWLNYPIPLELHHLDCDTSNNTIENLQMLCPNCHAAVHVKLRQK